MRAPDTVLFVSHAEHFGGSATSLRTLLRHLDPRVRRVLASPTGGRVVAALDADGSVGELVELAPVGRGASVTRVARNVSTLARWARRHRGSLLAVHANGLAEMAVAFPAARRARVPLVVWVHDADPLARRARRVVPLATRQARITWVAVSDAARRELAGAGWGRRAGITTIPNPIDPAAVVGGRASRSGPVRVAFLGTDTTRKGFDLLPAVASRLDGARLVVFARRHSGVEPAVARAWAELEGRPGVELAGRVDDVRRAYAASDIVFCPSRAESFGRVVAEAMANGLPVVASDLPPFRELLADGAGVLFPTGDATAATAALQRLVDDPDDRARRGELGREHARTFEPARVAAAFRELYSSGR